MVGPAFALGTLHEAAGPDPDRTALVDGDSGEAVSYGALSRRVARTANALADLGVGRGDRVALSYPNEVGYLYALFGAARIGAVPVPLNVELPVETLAFVLGDCEASVVVASPEEGILDRVLPAVEGADGVGTVAVDGQADRTVDGADVLSLAERAAAAPPECEPASVDGDDPALQPYTSGSTGRPKGVVLTHGGIAWNVTAFREFLDLDSGDRSLAVTPLYHKNAMTGAIKPMLSCGGSAVVQKNFDAGAAIDAIGTHGVTYMTGVPAIYKRLVAALSPGDDVDSLTWASCGSQTVPAALVESFEAAFGADLLEVYGLTEGGPVVTHSPRDGERKVGSAGVALPGGETRVIDPESGSEIPAGEPGELIVSNPGLGRYHERPDANDDAFEDRDGRRFLHTDDLVRKDGEGYHFVVGRLDDMLIVGGENVYPAEVEDLLARHGAVRDVAVVGAPHAEKGEAPVAFVVADGVTADDLKGYAIERGPAYAHPRRVFFVDELPLTGTGKVDREALERAARERLDGPL